jgi:hypothetical protein
MGISSDGLLFWGIDFGEYPEHEEGSLAERIFSGEDPEEWENVFAEFIGITRPTEEYEKAKEKYSQYWKEVREAAKKIPCEFRLHCSYDYPMHYACVSESLLSADRGYPTIIEPEHFIIKPTWHKDLKYFVELFGLTWSEPKWHLASLYG